MNFTKIAIVIAMSMSVVACGTSMPNSQSGFLSSYENLQTDDAKTSVTLRARTTVDPTRITVSEVEWHPNAGTHIDAEDRAKLLAQLRDELHKHIATLPSAPGGRPAVIRAAITKVEAVSPTMNTIATVLLIGPLDRGGAAVEIEAIDPDSRKQIAAIRQGYFAPLSELRARFRKYAPAEIALKKTAEDFVQLLGQP
jgi:hypothetical protein